MKAVKPRHLLHLAWNVEHGTFWESPNNDAWVDAGRELADSFIRHGGRRIVGAGTCAEYRWNGTRCCEASTPTEPATRYGRAKHRLHQTLAAAAVETGVEIAWGRVFFVYGSGEDPRKLLSATAALLNAREPIQLRTPERKLDFVHVDDVADAFVHLLGSDLTGGVNVASGVATPVRQAVEELARRLGVEPLLGAGEAGTEPDVTADVTRLSGICRWNPRSPAEGIAELLGGGYGRFIAASASKS